MNKWMIISITILMMQSASLVIAAENGKSPSHDQFKKEIEAKSRRAGDRVREEALTNYVGGIDDYVGGISAEQRARLSAAGITLGKIQKGQGSKVSSRYSVSIVNLKMDEEIAGLLAAGVPLQDILASRKASQLGGNLHLNFNNGISIGARHANQFIPIKDERPEAQEEVDTQQALSANDPLFEAAFHGIDKNLDPAIRAAKRNGTSLDVKFKAPKGFKSALIKDGDTPLLVASRNGHQKLVEMLLAAGASMESADESPLIDAHPDVVDTLRDAEAKRMNAEIQAEKERIKQNAPQPAPLLRYRPQVTRTRVPDTALAKLTARKDTSHPKRSPQNSEKTAEIAQFERETEAKLHRAQTEAAQQELEAAVVALNMVKPGAPITNINSHNNVAFLFEVASSGNAAEIDKAIAQALQKEGTIDFALRGKLATIRGKSVEGDTPLIIATRNGHLEIVKKLIKAGAGMMVENSTGESAYILSTLHSDIYNYLVAELNKQNQNNPSCKE